MTTGTYGNPSSGGGGHGSDMSCGRNSLSRVVLHLTPKGRTSVDARYVIWHNGKLLRELRVKIIARDQHCYILLVLCSPRRFPLLGYTSDDCSVPSRSPPQLIGVHNGGTCDIKAFHCKQVRLVGEGFHNSRELMCSFLEVKVNMCF